MTQMEHQYFTNEIMQWHINVQIRKRCNLLDTDYSKDIQYSTV